MSRSILVVSLLIALGAQAQSDTTLVPFDTDSTRTISDPDSTANTNPRTPVITITADDLDSELGAQDISGILQSSRDIFTSTAGYNFGLARFRIRGYDSENTLVTINGVLMNDLETGWAQWSTWAGLNDVTRWMQVRTGIGATRYNFGGLGGSTDINVRSSSLRKGVRVSYASANRAYSNRLMVTGSTGMMANGWSFSFSGSRRWAQEGYVDGTSFNAYGYFLAAENKIDNRHTVSFSAFGAPIVQGRQGVAIQEAYDLTGNNYYNPNWGYQNGEKRNARMTFDHKPLLMFSHYFKPDSVTEWNTSMIFSFGRDGSSSLNWFDAKDPRPDYYRYLPSYNTEQEPGIANEQATLWQNNDPNTTQINWDQLYFANGKNLYSVQNADGIAGNTVTGLRSKYIMQEQRADPIRWAVNSVYNKKLSEDRHMTIGGSINIQRTHYFNTIDDLLGGEFWVDIDQFADRDFNDTLISQNDLDRPNKVVREGDVFGYDYYINTRMINVFGQLEKKWNRFEGYVGGQLSYTSFWRFGNLQNGRFPDDSEGKSPANDFFNFSAKAGGLYKITGRHFIAANAAFVNRAPTSNIAYLSPRIRGATVPGLQSESLYSGDIGYVIRAPRLKGRATVYYTKMTNQIWSRNYYHDEFLTMVNYSMTGVDQINQGLELGIEANLTSTWQMTVVYANGDYRYASRPEATLTRNNSSEEYGNRTVYWKNYKVGGMPQEAASLGFRYNSPKFWFVGVNGNWFSEIYLDPNPDRRTAEAVGNYVSSDPQVTELLVQERLDDNVTVDLFAGKSWMLKGNNRLAFNISVSNILNNQEFQVGGFEQLRYDRTDVGKFPPKYSYLYGRTYFAMVTFSF